MKIQKSIIVIAAFLLPYFAVSQPVIENLFKKYEDKKGFQSVIISGELIKLFIPGIVNAKTPIDSLDLSAIDFSKINGVKILICERDNVKEDFIKDIEKVIDKINYISLLQINNDEDKVKVLATKNNSSITNILVYHKGSDSEVHLIHVDGIFEEKAIMNIANKVMVMPLQVKGPTVTTETRSVTSAQ